MARVLIAGFGYVGRALGAVLAARGDDVTGLCRSGGSSIEGVQGLAIDLADSFALQSLPGGWEQIVYAVGPDERTEFAYRRAYVEGLGCLLRSSAVRASPLARLVLVSSTAVFAESSGGWVDESSEVRRDDFTASLLLEGEELARSTGCAVVLRLGGIYGPSRARLLELAYGADELPQAKARYSNRIHQADCARVIAHLLDLPEPQALYLGVDDEPADQRDIIHWLRSRVQVGRNLRTDAADSALAPIAARRSTGSQSRGNKRCSNARLRASGYRFIYPTYREGYAALLEGLRPSRG